MIHIYFYPHVRNSSYCANSSEWYRHLPEEPTPTFSNCSKKPLLELQHFGSNDNHTGYPSPMSSISNPSGLLGTYTITLSFPFRLEYMVTVQATTTNCGSHHCLEFPVCCEKQDSRPQMELLMLSPCHQTKTLFQLSQKWDLKLVTRHGEQQRWQNPLCGVCSLLCYPSPLLRDHGPHSHESKARSKLVW